jgi:hypothetical protein
MKFTKMELSGQLDADGAKRFASRLGVAYILGSIGVVCTGLAALIWAVRWW